MWLSIAFMMGFVGSLHCVGMCGPLMMISIGASSGNPQHRIKILSYHSGRILMYGLLGIIAGFMGQGINVVGWQKYLTLSMGVAIIVAQIHPGNLPNYLTRGVQLLKKTFQLYKKSPSPFSRFALGMVNGLLPCGLVYLALAASITEGQLLDTTGFMLVFGLGTLPALLALQLGIRILPIPKFKSLLSYFSLLVGVLLIFRGLEWGIPFLSPDFSSLIQQTISLCS